MNIFSFVGAENSKYIFIGLAIVAVISLIISITKKMIKLAVFCFCLSLLSGMTANFIGEYKNNLGLSVNGSVISVNNKYSTDVRFNLDDIKKFDIKNDSKSNKRLVVTVELKDGSFKEFFIGSDYEEISRKILEK